MIYTLLDPDHPLLLTALPEITAETEPESRPELLANMVETMKHYGGIGLSANQCGIPIRMFVFGDNENYIPCFNPRIIATHGELIPIEEGCLTYPGLFIKIFRSEKVSVTFEDENRELHEETFEGLMARVFGFFSLLSPKSNLKDRQDFSIDSAHTPSQPIMVS